MILHNQHVNLLNSYDEIFVSFRSASKRIDEQFETLVFSNFESCSEVAKLINKAHAKAVLANQYLIEHPFLKGMNHRGSINSVVESYSELRLMFPKFKVSSPINVSKK
jgi:hypothetical protein